MIVTEIIKGRYIDIYCTKKYSFLIENILKYYDTEEYANTCVYYMLYDVNYDIVNKYDKVIFYNVEHLFCYGVDFLKNMGWGNIIKYCLSSNKLLYYWDFDVINYRCIVDNIPEILTYYQFKPLRYVDRPRVTKDDLKKYDAIHIGVTRCISPYRDLVLNRLGWFYQNKDLPDFSLKTIEHSPYSLEELYDEINSCKCVLNIPRISTSGQEQVRMGELISMNCDIFTQTGEYAVSYLSDFIHEIDYTSDAALNDIVNIVPYKDVATQFKNKTKTNYNYSRYVNECFDKWYEKPESYILSTVIAAVKKESLVNTINSIKENNNFNRIQVIIVDISGGDDIEKIYNEQYNYVNFYYIKSNKNSKERAFNIGLKASIGKYINFITSGDTYRSLFLDYVINFLNNNTQYDIYITSYIVGDYNYILTFKENKIGPMLPCCFFRRNIINIDFDENIACSTIIFSGVLCETYNYIHNGFSVTNWEQFGYIMPQKSDDDFIEIKNDLPENVYYVEFTYNHIIAKLNELAYNEYNKCFSKYTRYDIINKIIEKYNFKKYLEIGISFGEAFSKVNCEYKVGVDPNINTPATHYMTSDEYFNNLSVDDKFDVIFIDGLHTAEQCYIDINNAIKHLSDNGYILCHDMHPLNKWLIRKIENWTFSDGCWNGDVYKAFIKFRKEHLDYKCCTLYNCDWGIGIITKGQGTDFECDNIDDISYEEYYNKKEYLMNFVDVEDFLDKLLTDK